MHRPSYYEDNPVAILRQKRAEASARRASAYRQKYGPTRLYGLSKVVAEGAPRAVRLKRSPRYELAQRHKAIMRSRAELLVEAQHGCCYLCGEPFSLDDRPTQDHVVPVALGGKNARNILMAHQRCNGEKSNRAPTPDELSYLRAVNFALENGERVPPRWG